MFIYIYITHNRNGLLNKLYRRKIEPQTTIQKANQIKVFVSIIS